MSPFLFAFQALSAPVVPIDERVPDFATPAQEACVEVCAASFGLSKTSVSRSALDRCVSTEIDPGESDRLHLPWNGKTWEEPEPAEVCAHHLILHGYISKRAPAGFKEAGIKGRIARAAAGITRYGQASAWSTSSCLRTALQCQLGAVLTIPIEERRERWPAVRDTLSRETSPWCAAVEPWLVPPGPLVATFDAPCRKGVEEAREIAQAVADYREN